VNVTTHPVSFFLFPPVLCSHTIPLFHFLFLSLSPPSAADDADKKEPRYYSASSISRPNRTDFEITDRPVASSRETCLYSLRPRVVARSCFHGSFFLPHPSVRLSRRRTVFLMMMKLAASALSAFSPPLAVAAAVGNFAQGGSTVDVDDGYLFRDI
jgi:hypothetical protein